MHAGHSKSPNSTMVTAASAGPCDGPLADFLGRYVSWALEMYLQAQSGLGGLYNPFSALRPFPAPTSAERTRPAEPASPARDELGDLRREVAALRRSLKGNRKPRRQ